MERRKPNKVMYYFSNGHPVLCCFLIFSQLNYKIYIRQVRISFTELNDQELIQHAKLFDPFSIQFSIDVLRRLGALPVIYIPQNLEDKALSSIGTTIVAEINDIKHTISLRRIDEAVVIDSFEGKPISKIISCVRVPSEVYDEAKKMYGEIVKIQEDQNNNDKQ